MKYVNKNYSDNNNVDNNRVRELTVAYYDLCSAIDEMDKLYRFHYKPGYKDAINAINYIGNKANIIKKEFNIVL